MSLMEEYLELQDQAAKCKKDLKERQDEIVQKDEKILAMSDKINFFTNEVAKYSSDNRHFRNMVTVLETEKKNLERERKRLIKEQNSLNRSLESTSQTSQAKEEALVSKEKQLQKKDTRLTEHEDKLEIFRKKVDSLLKEKEKYQTDKLAVLEEKLLLVEKVGKLEKTAQEKDQKIKKFKEKSRQAQDGLLGSSMEMEKVREENSELADKLQEITEELEKVSAEKREIEDRFGLTPAPHKKSKKKGAKKGSADEAPKKFDAKDLFARGTGTYSNISTLVAHFKFKLENVNRTVRIIIPELSFLSKYNLKEALFDLPNNILKNLASSVDMKGDKELLNELKLRNFRVTDYQDTNLLAMTVDNSTAALAVYNEERRSVTGLFSNNEELVKLLSQAIMTPFIKGKKIPQK